MRRFVVLLAIAPWLAHAQEPAGTISGSAWAHTQQSIADVVAQAQVFLPAAATGTADYFGPFKNSPSVLTGGRKVPVVLFLHGSSGLGTPAIAEYQRWLGTLGFASFAPNSFALPERVTYKSPVDKTSYERIHQLRLSEIAPSLHTILRQPWADTTRLILAGTSEGAVAVARYQGSEFAARIIYSWSCEDNYFVIAPDNFLRAAKPVLNIISANDPYFSRANSWLGNDQAAGHCGAALQDNPQASVVLIPNAPHTILGLPAARNATAGFLLSLTAP